MNPSKLALAALLVALLDCRRAMHEPPPTSSPTTPGVAAAPHFAAGSWLALDNSTDAPSPAQLALQDVVVGTFFDDDVQKASGGYTYAYGGKTRNKLLPSGSAGNRAVFAVYFEDDYSGVNISLGNGKYLDLTPYRRSGSLTFWVKGGPGAQKFMVGLMDNQGGVKKVQ